MNKSVLQIIAFSLFLLWGPGTYASTNRDTLPAAAFHLDHYTDEDGLPQNSINSIARDRYGFIWLATEDGLARFDGREFKRMTWKKRMVRSHRFQTLYRDAVSGNIVALNDAEQRVEMTKREEKVNTVDGNMPGMDVWWKLKNADTSGKVMVFKLPHTSNGWKQGVVTTKIGVRTGKNAFFICGNDSVTFFRNGRIVYTVPFYIGNRWNFFLNNGRLCYLHGTEKVTVFSEAGKKELVIKGPLAAALKRGDKNKNPLIFWNVAEAGQQLIGYDHSFYTVRDITGSEFITQCVFTGFDINGNDIKSFYYDQERGRLYLGSLTRGLFVLTGKAFTTLTTGTGSGEFGDLLSDIYYGQTPYGDSSVLAAQGKLLSLYGKPMDIPSVSERVSMDYYSLLTDKRGDIWNKTGFMLFRFSPTDFSLKEQWKMPDAIANLYEGLNGDIWIGARKKGMWRLSPGKDHVIPELFYDQPEHITSFLQPADDTMLIGTASGFFRMKLSSKKTDTIQGLNGAHIRSIYEAAPGEIWLTTYGSGFYLFRGNNVISFPTDRYNYLATAHCIVEDKKGFFWITTNKGLFQVARSDLLSYADGKIKEVYYHYYDKRNGFNTNEFNGGCQPCATILNNGYISFPSVNGLVLFDPGEVRPELPEMPLYIDGVALDGKDTVLTALEQLPHDFSHFTLFISTPYMGDRKNLFIQYAIVKNNGDTLWQEVPEKGAISVSTMLPGKFRLLIRKRNGFGENNYSLISLPLQVLPAWYHTFWFYMGCLLALSAGCWLFVRARLQLAGKRNRELEARINDRTRELSHTLKELKVSQERLVRQREFENILFHSVSHDIRTPLRFLALTAGKVYEGLQKENTSDYILTSKNVRDHVNTTYYMVNNLLDYLKLHKSNGSKNDMSIFDLHQLTVDKKEVFSAIAAEQGVRIENKVPVGTMLHNNRLLLDIIIHNLLDNAVKATMHGLITIEAGYSGEDMLIEMTDTGAGMPPEVMSWINTEVRPEANNDTLEKVGTGWLMIRELAVITRLRIRVVSANDKGTTVVLYCPLQLS
jgi:ligand-binding sensor domain-containing protein/anti-sigma regulatory factor (Ser/Thr protein kinase)